MGGAGARGRGEGDAGVRETQGARAKKGGVKGETRVEVNPLTLTYNYLRCNVINKYSWQDLR